MSEHTRVSSSPLSKLFREMSLEERRAVFQQAGNEASEIQRRVIDEARRNAVERLTDK